jgi:hypothetical protein
MFFIQVIDLVYTIIFEDSGLVDFDIYRLNEETEFSEFQIINDISLINNFLTLYLIFYFSSKL